MNPRNQKKKSKPKQRRVKKVLMKPNTTKMKKLQLGGEDRNEDEELVDEDEKDRDDSSDA